MKLDLSQMHQNMLTIAFRLLVEATEIQIFLMPRIDIIIKICYRPDDFSGETK